MSESDNETPTDADSAKKAKHAEEQIKARLRQLVDENAYARLMNVFSVNRQLFLAAAKYVIGASQRVERILTEKEVVSILVAIKQQTEKETSITFHSK